jgi:pyruvate dehydrogenase E2 component (dihydrolipoamide acetyltransferase)
MASENGIQLSWIKPQGGRVEKADVLAYITEHRTAPSTQRAGKVLASPKARRLAQETQQDLGLIRGTGPDGAVIADDVRIGEAKATQASVPAGIPIAPVEAQVSTPVPATNAVWQRMAEHTASSWNAAPHFYLHRTVRATNLLAWHARLPQDPQEKITITDLLVLIASRALLRHPRINVVWENGHIRPLSDIGISLAVAVDEGLVVPVIHGADRLSPAAIAKERNQLVARAQAGRLRVTDISGGSFTISNLGMYGVDSFDAVLNGPQSAILAVGRIMDQVIPVNGAAQVQPVMQLSVSFDHRSIDGATGAKFLSTLCDMVEEPLLLLG